MLREVRLVFLHLYPVLENKIFLYASDDLNKKERSPPFVIIMTITLLETREDSIITPLRLF